MFLSRENALNTGGSYSNPTTPLLFTRLELQEGKCAQPKRSHALQGYTWM